MEHGRRMWGIVRRPSPRLASPVVFWKSIERTGILDWWTGYVKWTGAGLGWTNNCGGGVDVTRVTCDGKLGLRNRGWAGRSNGMGSSILAPERPMLTRTEAKNPPAPTPDSRICRQYRVQLRTALHKSSLNIVHKFGLALAAVQRVTIGRSME